MNINGRLIGNSAYRYKDTLFFTVFGMNIIGCLDLKTLNVKYLFGPREEKFAQFMLWGDIIVWHESIVLAPYQAKDVWAFDIRNKAWKKISDVKMPVGYSDHRFVGMELYTDKLFLFGHNYSNILCIDLINMNKSNVLDEALNNSPKWTRFFAQSYAKNNNRLYLANHLTNHILKVDMNTFNFSWDRIGNNNRSDVGIISKENDYWIIPTTSNYSLLCWNESTGSIQEYEFSVNMSNIWGAVEFLGNLYFYGPDDGMVVFNIENERFENTDKRVGYIKKIDDEMYMWTEDGGLIIKNRDCEITIDLKMDQEVLNNYIREHSYDIRGQVLGEIINESSPFSLLNFISLI